MAFRDISDVYDRFNNAEAYMDWFGLMFQLLPQGTQRFLDLGCGTGLLTQMLAALADEAVGIDVDSGMIDKALKAETVENLHFEQMDMTALTFADESFTLLTAFLDTLCFLPNLASIKQTLAEAYRVLKPGGLFVFDVWQPEQMTDVFDGFNYSDVDEKGALLWHSFCTSEEEPYRVEHYLTVFDERESGFYERLETTLTERTYELETYRQALMQVGFAEANIQLLDEAAWEQYPEFAGRFVFIVEK